MIPTSRPEAATPGHIPACRRTEHGFSLIEAMVTMVLTSILMLMSWQIFFAMKRSADQMQLNTEPRQIARRASEYLASYVRSASDMNPELNNPAAIMVWWETNGGPSGGGDRYQASWNNVTNANLADVGTDIITVGHPTSALSVTVENWPGSVYNGGNAWWNFYLGCDGTADEAQKNMDLFQELTGAHIDPDSGWLVSEVLLLVSPDTGQINFYQITNYLDNGSNNDCCDPSIAQPGIHVTATPGQSAINPPAHKPGMNDPRMRLGLKWMSFRVRNGWLEQKVGIFDPRTDNPGNAFVPLLPDIEDLQLAWIYRDGTVWNTAVQQLPAGTYTNNVPAQGSNDTYDVINVVGMRLTVTARSSSDATWEDNPRFRRPAAEDRSAGGLDRFYHESSTTTVLIRNRLLER